MLRLRFFRYTLGASVVLCVAGIVGILAALFPAITQAPIVSLHYNIHFGVDAIGAWWRLFVPSGLAAVAIVGNAFYAARVWSRERVVAYAFAVAALMINAFVLLHVIFIVLLNLSSL